MKNLHVPIAQLYVAGTFLAIGFWGKYIFPQYQILLDLSFWTGLTIIIIFIAAIAEISVNHINNSSSERNQSAKDVRK